MNILKFKLLILGVIFCLNLSAIKIYVSTKGSDGNTGTKDQPLASLTGARDFLRQLRATGKLNEGVRVIIADGTYYMNEPLVLTEFDSGNDGSSVVFTAEEGAKPVFVGGVSINNWEKVTEKLWKARVPEVQRYGLYFEQLYVNGKFAIRAKSPNQGFYFLKDVQEITLSKGKGRVSGMAVQKMTLFPKAAADLETFTESDFNDAVLTFYHKWDNSRKRVADFDADSSVILTVGKGMKPWNKLDNQTRFTIENYKAALDTSEEWFLERNGDLYYVPNPSDNLANMKVFAPVTNRFMVIKGDDKTGKKVQNIRFENLHFEASGYRMPPGGDEPAQAASPVDAVIIADYARQIAFVNCEISQIGTSAIWFRKGCDNCLVSHCSLHDLGAGGVKIGEIKFGKDSTIVTNHIVIDNNIIQHGGYLFPCAVGVIIFQASDNSITHNDIADFRYSGVSVGWIWGYAYSPTKRNKIEFNHIHHLGWGELCDMGGVYTLGKSEGTTVSNNLIHHIYSFDYGGWGLYTDEGSTKILMENNLVYNCKNAGFHQHYGEENIIRNNIFAFNQLSQLQLTRVEEHKSLSFVHNIVCFDTGVLYQSMGKDRWLKAITEIDYNCYWNTRKMLTDFHGMDFNAWQKLGKDRHSVLADPLFTDPLNLDFHFKSLKVAKNIGFVPFDYTAAGVYGTEEWKNQSMLDPDLMKKYDIAVVRNAKKGN